jgi:pimeloyl-ACP methyl ester carboxylesterase
VESRVPNRVQNRVTTPVLEIAYEQTGERSQQVGAPVILLHGFPYDVRAFDEVTTRLAAHGRLVLAPYLRGYGPTSFRHEEVMRSGQQAALAQDLKDFMDALAIERAVVAGYGWGGRAACVAAALWPERVQGLVTAGGYTIQDIARAMEPAAPQAEHNYCSQARCLGAVQVPEGGDVPDQGDRGDEGTAGQGECPARPAAVADHDDLGGEGPVEEAAGERMKRHAGVGQLDAVGGDAVPGDGQGEEEGGQADEAVRGVDPVRCGSQRGQAAVDPQGEK